jgi:hypothetical protein
LGFSYEWIVRAGVGRGGVRRDGRDQRGSEMARKVVNRKELREQSDAAERSGADAAAEKKTAKKKAKKKAKRKSRAKAAAEVRLKAFWGVFNQSMRRVALFEYRDRKLADEKAAELTESQNNPHFVQIVKEVIEE